MKGRIQASELKLLWGGPVTFSNTNILDFAVVTFSCRYTDSYILLKALIRNMSSVLILNVGTKYEVVYYQAITLIEF